MKDCIREITNILLCLLLLLWSVGCDEKGTYGVTPPPENPAELWPLTVGNYWVLHFEEWEGDTLIYETVDSFAVDSSFFWRGDEWFRVWERFDIYAIYYVMRNDAEGVRMMFIEEGDITNDTTEGLYLKYPAAVGDRWKVPWDIWYDPRDTILIEAIGDEVTVPAGRFEGCYRYRFNNSGADEGMWYQPGFGLVRSRWRYQTWWQTFDLVRFGLR